MTEREYRTHPAVSRSELWRLKDSPEKFAYYKENPTPPTPAMAFGQFFHKMALEPESVWDDFVAQPEIDRRTTEGKAAWKEFLEKANNRTVVTLDMVAKASQMCSALYANPFAKKLLNGEHETPYFWTDDMTGENCKCRTDVITTVGGFPLIIDLKTTADASTEGFIREAIKYGYDFQSAMYGEGVKACTGVEHGFVFIAIEKEPPYAVNILQADELFLRRGYDLYRELLGIYHECKESGKWYGYLGKFDAINTLGLPPWLAKEYE